jgi:hypothetical protein
MEEILFPFSESVQRQVSGGTLSTEQPIYFLTFRALWISEVICMVVPVLWQFIMTSIMMAIGPYWDISVDFNRRQLGAC